MNKRLATLLADVLRIRVSDVQPSLTKEGVGSWDSLKQMDLVVSLESEYSITLEISDILRMQSVAGIIEVLADKGVNFED
jgi:acyl carrier protein